MQRSAGDFPTLDFAGGTVVHITSGVSALVCALYLGKRLGYPKEPMPPHSVVISFIGACLLWVGWFGFNAGSALARERTGHERVCGDAFWGGRGGDRLEWAEWMARRQAERFGRNFGSSGRTGSDHTGIWVRFADVGDGDRTDRGGFLLLDGHRGEGEVRL